MKVIGKKLPEIVITCYNCLNQLIIDVNDVEFDCTLHRPDGIDAVYRYRVRCVECATTNYLTPEKYHQLKV